MLACRGLLLGLATTLLHVPVLSVMRHLAVWLPYLSTGASFVETSFLALVLAVNLTCPPLEPAATPIAYHRLPGTPSTASVNTANTASTASTASTLSTAVAHKTQRHNKLHRLYLNTLTIATAVWIHFITSFYVLRLVRWIDSPGFDPYQLHSTQFSDQ